MHCLSIVILSAIIIVTPSLSFQSQTNSSKYTSSDNNANDNNNTTNSLQPDLIRNSDEAPMEYHIL